MKSVLNIHWKDWYWSWNSNTLATWCEELTHLKKLWCWERLKAEREGDSRGWDGWMISLTWWIWIEQAPRVSDGQGSLVGCMQSMGSQRVGHNWVTELNWTDIYRNQQKQKNIQYRSRIVKEFAWQGVALSGREHWPSIAWCDGSLYLSVWPVYSGQLLGQTSVYMLLWSFSRCD